MYTYLTPDHLRDWPFRRLLIHAGLNRETAAALFCRSVRTIERWKDQPPPCAKDILILLAGHLGIIHKDWEGWKIDRQGMLWTTEGWSLGHGEIRALPYRYALIAELKRQLREEPKNVDFSNVVPIRLDR